MSASSSQAAGNNNPTGKNQYQGRPPKGDPITDQHLRNYHQQGYTSYQDISDLLKAKQGIILSRTSVYRRLRDLGLSASSNTARSMPDVEKRQLVLDELSRDPAGKKGPAGIKEAITRSTGVHLPRDFVRDEMKLHDPEGFNRRAPTAKKIHREPLVSLGPNHEWSCDGHDKLAQIGFPIWGVRDKWSGKWLGLWVVPNNRLKVTIAYLYLSLVYELGGMPLQTTTDRGSETSRVFALSNALREFFDPELDLTELPSHRFLQSIHNIVIERGWLRVRLAWGENIKLDWNKGQERGIYDGSNPTHYNLAQWLWSTLIQAELDDLKMRFNTHKTRHDRTKVQPSGVTPDFCYTLPQRYNGQDQLIPVDRNTIQGLMKELGGEDLLRFVSVEYEAHAKVIFARLNTKLDRQNIWDIFTAMLPDINM